MAATTLAKPIQMSEIKNIFTKETLIPISFMLVMVYPIVYVTNLNAKVETLETQLQLLKSEAVKKEVYTVEMRQVNEKLDQILKVVEKK